MRAVARHLHTHPSTYTPPVQLMFVDPAGNVNDLFRLPGWPTPGFLGAFSASGGCPHRAVRVPMPRGAACALHATASSVLADSVAP